MRIALTPAAREQLAVLAGDDRPIKLVYDMEGCGCANDGVPRLKRVAAREPGDEAASETPVEILYDRHLAFLFEERLILDADRSAGTFKLKSDGQIYATGLTIEDHAGLA